jgi:hypothetical protein
MSLALRTGAAVVRRERSPYGLDEEILEFYRDLLRPYGDEVDEDRARKGRNTAFVDLAERAVRTAPAPGGPPDLLVLAYALPDLHPLKTVSSHLNHRFGDESRSFAVSEQGVLAPFTALRIADAYHRSGRCRSVALFVLEQTTFPYAHPFVDARDLVDSGVYLRFDVDGRWRVAGLHATDDLPALLGTLAGPDTLLVAGPAADLECAASVDCHRASEESHCTSVWRALADHHADWATRYRTLLLCDTDTAQGRSQVAVLSRTEEP